MRLQTCSELPISLEEQVERVVRSRTGGMIRELRIDILDDRVVITGRAATYYTKQRATHAALDVLEDVSLINEIEVC